jgi:hypothetical protein
MRRTHLQPGSVQAETHAADAAADAADDPATGHELLQAAAETHAADAAADAADATDVPATGRKLLQAAAEGGLGDSRIVRQHTSAYGSIRGRKLLQAAAEGGLDSRDSRIVVQLYGQPPRQGAAGFPYWMRDGILITELKAAYTSSLRPHTLAA